MYKYKTKDGSDRVFPGIGQTVNGVIETEYALESPNLELVEHTTEKPQPAKSQGVVGTAPAPSESPNAVTEAKQTKPQQEEQN